MSLSTSAIESMFPAREDVQNLHGRVIVPIVLITPCMILSLTAFYRHPNAGEFPP